MENMKTQDEEGKVFKFTVRSFVFFSYFPDSELFC